VSDCPREAAEAAFAAPVAPKADPSAISFFERYLTLWVALCMVVGALIGYYAPGVADALQQAQFAGINAVIAVLLWIMLFPMFATLDFTSLRAVGNAPGAILLTSVLNYRKYEKRRPLPLALQSSTHLTPDNPPGPCATSRPSGNSC
jgi:uncharacterized membrane protein (UPF0136 family)